MQRPQSSRYHNHKIGRKMNKYILLLPIIFSLCFLPGYSKGGDELSIRGTTYYYQAGRKVPVEGMTVYLYSDGKITQQVDSDNNGRFVFDKVLAGTYSITTPTVYPFNYTRLDDVYYDQDERIDIEIPRRRMLIINTIDTYSKQPVAGVRYSLIDNSTGKLVSGRRTDQDGRARLWDLDKGEYRLEIGGFEFDRLDPVVITLEEYTELEFEVEKFITISGIVNTICDGEISPAPDQFVRLREDPTWRLLQLDKPLASISNSFTDENGRFEIELREHLQPGTYYLTVSYKNYETETIWDRKVGGYKEITIERGKDIDDVELSLTLPKPAVVRGTIVHSDGSPAAGARLEGARFIDVVEGIGVDGFRTFADENGRFGPQEVWPGLYRIIAYYDLKPGVWYGSDSMEMELSPGESKEISATLRESSYTFRRLGEYYYYKKDIPSAIEALEKSLKIDPESGVSYYYLALIAIDQDEIDKAAEIKEDCMNRIDETNVNYDYYLKLFKNIEQAIERR